MTDQIVLVFDPPIPQFVTKNKKKAFYHTYLIEYKTFPFLNILSSLLSVVTS